MDLRGVIREARPILLRVRDLAGQAAVGQLQAEEVPEQSGPGRFGELVEDFLDPRPPARPPGGLEVVASRIRPPGQRRREGARDARGRLAHGEPSSDQRSRMSFSLRPTVCRMQPSRPAISRSV